MTIEFKTFTSDIFNSIHSVSIFNIILSNILYTSIVLSILLIIILLFIYPCKEKTHPSILFRVFVYLVVVNTLIFSAHHSTISNKYSEKYSNDDSIRFINSINGKGVDIYGNDRIKIVPKFAEYKREGGYDDISSTTHTTHENKEQSVSDILGELEARI